MKKWLSIVLLVITTWYIMPVKTSIYGKNQVSLNCSDDNSEETDDVKKETKKDFILYCSQIQFSDLTNTTTPSSPSLYLSSLLHIVETPPPDKV